MCSFKDESTYYGKCKLVPSAKAYTNMFKNLKKIEQELKDCFNMYENLKEYGVNVGEDRKIFLSKVKGNERKELIKRIEMLEKEKREKIYSKNK